MVLAPDHGIGVLTFSNTGAFNPRGAPVPVANALLDLPEDAVRADVPERPQVWSDLCGWYSFGPGVLLDPQQRALLGAGLEVVVRRDHFTIRGQTPVPAVRKGLRLHPDGDDPYVFRIDVSGFGAGTAPVVFSRGPGGQVTALHIGLIPMSFQKRPDVQTPDRGSTAPSPHHHGGRYPPASHHQGTTEFGRITAAVPCERLLGGQLATMISLRGVSLFVKVIGRGYPLLLMHGGPGQTSGQVPGGLVRLAAM